MGCETVVIKIRSAIPLHMGSFLDIFNDHGYTRSKHGRNSCNSINYHSTNITYIAITDHCDIPQETTTTDY